MESSVRSETEYSFDRLLVRGRWIVLLSVLLTLVLGHRIRLDHPSIFYVVLLGVVYNAALGVWLGKHTAGTALKVVVLAADLLFVIGLVSLSGGIESPFFDTFYLVVISAGVQFGIYGALSVAAVSSAILLTVEAVTGSGRLAEIDRVLSTIPYLFLVALTSAFLARQLSREADRRRRAELQTRELELLRERGARELEVAQAVQAALLPSELPSLPNIKVAARTLPAREIGGDLYDFIYRPSGSLTAAIVDISGKGVPAALALSGLMSSLAGSRRLSPQELMETLNHHMLEHTPEEMFATMSICTVVPRRHKLYLASAGHEPLMIVRASTGAVEEFSADGMPLGISDQVRFAVKSTNLEDGDLVVMYTDGVTDARCGDDRLEAAGVTEFLTQHRHSPPQTIVDELFHKLQTECELSDDATVVVMQLVGDQAPPAEGLSAPAVEG